MCQRESEEAEAAKIYSMTRGTACIIAHRPFLLPGPIALEHSSVWGGHRMLLLSVAKNSMLLVVLDMCCSSASIASMPR
jgi:hypothetical protein